MAQLSPSQGSFCVCIQPMRDWGYSVTPSLIGWAHKQNDPCHWKRRFVVILHVLSNKCVIQNTAPNFLVMVSNPLWSRYLDSLQPDNTVWHYKIWVILIQVRACCLMTKNPYTCIYTLVSTAYKTLESFRFHCLAPEFARQNHIAKELSRTFFFIWLLLISQELDMKSVSWLY